MNLKPFANPRGSSRTGSALMLTLIMLGVAVAILAAALSWSSTSTRLTHRSIQYTRSVAAAEAATEKVISQVSHDFLYYGQAPVVAKLNTYKNIVPLSSDSPYWNTWLFNDANGNAGQTYVEFGSSTNYVFFDPPYNNLRAFVTTCTVVSNAKDTAALQDVTVGVRQQLQLLTIPVFQYALFSSTNMEISCGQPFDITGPVHANGYLYVEPDNAMKFESDVGAGLNVLYQRDTVDGDPRGSNYAGTFVFVQTNQPISGVPMVRLPIGTNNTSDAVRQIIMPPPTGEDAASALGLLRYYNNCDLLVTVSDSGVTATSGQIINNFATSIPTNEVATFISTNSTFWDGREGKYVQPVDVNVGNLAAWSQTNNNLRSVLGGQPVSSVYILDQRTKTTLGAVRVVNGATLPASGLTVATARPLYVQGDYNSDTAQRGTADTSGTKPASLIGDAITILSDAWSDASNISSSGKQGAAPTTVNAAFLTGVVETAPGHYSGGMENFPRFLENWGSANTFTYNGSMVKMFASHYATNYWGGSYYSPPHRNWAFDINFRDPAKLPPLTPSSLAVKRYQWNTLAAGQSVAP